MRSTAAAAVAASLHKIKDEEGHHGFDAFRKGILDCLLPLSTACTCLHAVSQCSSPLPHAWQLPPILPASNVTPAASSAPAPARALSPAACHACEREAKQVGVFTLTQRALKQTASNWDTLLQRSLRQVTRTNQH